MENKEIQQILSNITTDTYELGNQVLYDMCKSFPLHTNENEIISKVWLVGRAYAASIERRRKNAVNEINDDFYKKIVGPIFVKQNFDKCLMNLKNENHINYTNILAILNVHKKLVDIFFEMTNINKRSLSSKYLHFHFPNLFGIYDSRVVDAIKYFDINIEETLFKEEINENKLDKEYSHFIFRLLKIKDNINQKFRHSLSLRQLDSFLIEISNANLRKKFTN